LEELKTLIKTKLTTISCAKPPQMVEEI